MLRKKKTHPYKDQVQRLISIIINCYSYQGTVLIMIYMFSYQLCQLFLINNQRQLFLPISIIQHFFYPSQTIKIAEILEDEWFKKGYKPQHFEEGEDVCLDDVYAAFNASEVYGR
jgi:hypothetical protein